MESALNTVDKLTWSDNNNNCNGRNKSTCKILYKYYFATSKMNIMFITEFVQFPKDYSIVIYCETDVGYSNFKKAINNFNCNSLTSLKSGFMKNRIVVNRSFYIFIRCNKCFKWFWIILLFSDVILFSFTYVIKQKLAITCPFKCAVYSLTIGR